jgi:drug/metabolite transporter superfamily protein YnfA
MSALFLLASTFTLVFCLGLQSQLVNNGHWWSAFFNSLAIGSCNLVLFKLAPEASGVEIAAYLCGGPFGIVASMWFYRRVNATRTVATPTKALHG